MKFQSFGVVHGVVMLLTVLVPCLCAWLARLWGATVERRTAWLWAGVLLVNKIYVFAAAMLNPAMAWKDALPLQVCDLATFFCVFALCGRYRWSFELAYFWGLAGTLQAIITPDLDANFPQTRFFTFFISHSGVVGAVVYMVLAMKMRPTWGSLWRAYGWILAYALVVGIMDWALGVNYGYLCQKPAHASLMDYMGPWPWYIGSLMGIGLLSFIIYYLPFILGGLTKGLPGNTRQTLV